MRIRLTLDINRHRDEPPAEEMPDVYDASSSTTERAERQRIGFTIDRPAGTDPDTDEDDRR